jgi:hypothetical protein
VPLVRISVLKGRDPRLLTDIGDAVYRAMTATLNVPAHDNFRVITEHEPGHLSYDPFYAEVARLLEPLGVRPPDVFINLVEVRKENWSFGHGLAQYA